MLSGTHRNTAQEIVTYGRPAVEVVRELAAAYGARNLPPTTFDASMTMLPERCSIMWGIAARTHQRFGQNDLFTSTTICSGVYSWYD